MATTKLSIFLNYLQNLKPLLIEGFATHTASDNRTRRLVATRPDFLLPFRQKAPTIEKALNTIYSDPDRLLTPEGLWNILSFRGATYGSLYAKYDLEWFNSYSEWDEYYQTSTKTKNDQKEQYFVNICAYGFNNKHRTIKNISQYWTERGRWTSFIQSRPKIEEMFKFLNQVHKKEHGGKKVFQNIGSLTALLVCGDLVEVGILEMPSIEEWASLIYKVGKGATRGLQCLALLGDTFTKDQVINAFKELDTFLQEKLSNEDREVMGYSIIMLEHSLCKFTRILEKDDKPKKPSKAKKRRRTAVGKKKLEAMEPESEESM